MTYESVCPGYLRSKPAEHIVYPMNIECWASTSKHKRIHARGIQSMAMQHVRTQGSQVPRSTERHAAENKMVTWPGSSSGGAGKERSMQQVTAYSQPYHTTAARQLPWWLTAHVVVVG